MRRAGRRARGFLRRASAQRPPAPHPSVNRYEVEEQINMSEKSIIKFVKDCLAYIQTGLGKGLKPTDTDLFNVRDEMLGELNKLLYLFTLK